MSKNYQKFLKYQKKLGNIKGGTNVTISHTNPTPTFVGIDNECMINCIKYILLKNLPAEIKNSYIYYILFINKCEGFGNPSQNLFMLKFADQFEHIYNVILRDKINKIECSDNIILIETDQFQERVNNEIMLVGCGHHNILDDKYYNNHKHDCLFTVDIQLNKFPDLVLNANTPNLKDIKIIDRLQNKFKIIILEGVVFDEQSTYDNLSCFLQPNGIIMAPYSSICDQETIEFFSKCTYQIIFENRSKQYTNDNNHIYPLNEILEYYFNDDKKKLFDIMVEGKPNIYP